jgi:gliding motility-associated-like protein
MLRVLLLLLPPALSAQDSPCFCDQCPVFLDDNVQARLVFSVQGATQPVLGVGGQGLCGVSIHLTHTYISDLLVRLTSPSGASVLLMGPFGLGFLTIGTTWNITMVPCGETPLPDNNFAPVWSNSEPWGMLGQYNGRYHPHAGCLEDFDGGPVDGNWILEVLDMVNWDDGELLDFQLIFCDTAGLDCQPCEAAAGNLTQPDLTACAGSPTLRMLPLPTYTPPLQPPPPNGYTYTYALGGSGSVLLAYQDTVDLRAYPPGAYTICGLSVPDAQFDRLPFPDGQYTLQELGIDLSSGAAGICGSLSTGCIDITIEPPLPDSVLEISLCADSCFTFLGRTYCQTGVYTDTLTEGNCVRVARLFLQTALPQTVVETPGPWSCGDDDLLLLASSSPSAPGAQYFWSAISPGALIATSGSDSAYVRTPGVYQLSVCIDSGTEQCCDTTFAFVAQDTLRLSAPAWLSADSLICIGTPLALRTSRVNGALAYEWRWPAGLDLMVDPSDTSATLTWVSGLGGEVCVRALGACDTGAWACTIIRALGPPEMVDLTGPKQACAGDTALYHLAGLVPGGTSLFWQVQGGVIASGQGTDTLQVIWGAHADTAIVAVRFENACGPSDPVLLPVQVHARPTIDTLLSYCSDDTTGYRVYLRVSGGQPPYTSLFHPGTFLGSAFQSALLPNHTGAVFQVQDAHGCYSDLETTAGLDCRCTATVGIMPADTAHVCASDTAIVAPASGVQLGPGDTLLYVLHDHTGPVPGGIIGSSPSPQFPRFPGITSGETYFITAVAAPGSGDQSDLCRRLSNSTPVVWHDPPEAIWEGSTQTCAGDTAIWLIRGSGHLPVWIWFADPSGRVDSLRIDTFPTALHIPPSDGTWVLQGTADRWCTARDVFSEKQLEVHLSPQIVRLTVDTARCYGIADGLIQVDSIAGGTPPLMFRLNGGTYRLDPAFDNLPAGTYTLAWEDAKGCTDSAYIHLPYPEFKKIDLGPDREAAIGDLVYLKLSSDPPGLSWDTIIWSPNTGRADSVQGMVWEADRTSRFRVTATDAYGCSFTDSVLIRVEDNLNVYIPNAITPDAATNNIWIVYAGLSVSTIEAIQVFDRWGGLVHERRNGLPNDHGFGWDGRKGGRPLEAGVYSYRIELRLQTGAFVILFGELAIIR